MLVKEKPIKFELSNEMFELKTKAHDRLVETIDLSVIDTLDKDSLRREIKKIIDRILTEEKVAIPLNSSEKEQFCKEVQDEVLGLGPIEPFMHDSSISDILVNTYRQVYVEKFGKLQLTETRFKDNAHLKNIIDRIVAAVGRRIDESCPMVDARLPDGSRVN